MSRHRVFAEVPVAAAKTSAAVAARRRTDEEFEAAVAEVRGGRSALQVHRDYAARGIRMDRSKLSAAAREMLAV